jgi:hypothetical protein
VEVQNVEGSGCDEDEDVSEDDDAVMKQKLPVICPSPDQLRASYGAVGTAGAAHKLKLKDSKKRVLDPAMDDFINADNRGLGCQRVTFAAVFENDRAGDNLRLGDIIST